MEKLFNNILLPIYFNRQAEFMVEKAVHFANHLQCNLHLLHVIPVTPLSKLLNSVCELLGIRETHTAIKQEVYRWQTKFARQLKKGQLLFINLEKGDPGEKISQYIESHDIDMLLTDERLHFLPGFSQPANTSAQNLHFAILTMAAQLEFQRIKTIVLPIGRNLFLNKLRVAAYLAKESGAAIHLVAIETEEESKYELSYMTKAFRILKDNTNIPVVCTTLNKGNNAGAALIKYGEKVKADLIIVNPQVLNILRRQHRRLFHKTNSNESLPILAVD